MGMSVGGSETMSAEPNVIPMIDILLVLLIIFMISQPLSRMAMSVQVPPQERAQATSAVSTQIVLELTADGGYAFTRKLNGEDPSRLPLRPSDYFRRQVRVSSFAYEGPARLAKQIGGADILMCCSDYPHSEGTRTPVADYAAQGLQPGSAAAAALFGENVDFLLRRSG